MINGRLTSRRDFRKVKISGTISERSTDGPSTISIREGNTEMNDVEDNSGIDDLSEEDLGKIIDVLTTDGFYQQAEIVKVTCPVCGEQFMGTKRHAGGFIAGHRAFHEFENQADLIISSMGGQ